MIELINKSNYDFTDISSEQYRSYEFIDKVIIIKKPAFLAVSKSGHRILDEEGVSHYIPYGWKHLSWKVKEGEPHFVL